MFCAVLGSPSMYLVLPKVYYFSFSAVAACAFNWPTVDLLRKQGWTIWLTTSAWDYDSLKRKGNMESTMLRCTLESIVHDTWEEYVNYSGSFVKEK